MACLNVTSTSSEAPAAEHWDRRLWGTLIVLCGVLFLDGLDVSMVGMALPSIRSELGLTTSQLQWVVSGYALTFGLVLVASGRLGDDRGRKKMFMISLALRGISVRSSGLMCTTSTSGLWQW